MAREARLPYSGGVTVFKGILIGLGTMFLVLGAIGAVVPLLPTTPFLLAAGACFARSSDRMHSYLYNHRIFGEYLRNYEKREMTTPHKVRTLTVMWLGIGLSMFLSGKPIVIVVLGCIATLVTIHIVRLKPVLTAEQAEERAPSSL